MAPVPQLGAYLPQLVAFALQARSDYQAGTLADWPTFIRRVRAFYTPAMMETIEKVAPGWNHMATFADQQTLIHVTSVFVALYDHPEYAHISTTFKHLMEWIVLFHDIAKEAVRGKHDYVHGFRSAALAGKALPTLGFPINQPDTGGLEDWAQLTHNAIVFHEGHEEYIQDNRQLPAITAGIDRLFSDQSPASLVIKPILLHLSIDSDPDYPTVAPLTEAEIQRFVVGDVLPLLRLLTLIDNDSWNLFDAEQREVQRQKTHGAFQKIAQQVHTGEIE
ncbi:MAG: hypothetical protein R3E39_08540 [Anaerolineae bacterium]